MEKVTSSEIVIMEDGRILATLEEIRNLQLLAAKEMLTVSDVAVMTGFKESYVRKMAEAGTFPCYRPFGKRIFFKKSEINEALMAHRESTASELVKEYESRNKKRYE